MGTGREKGRDGRMKGGGGGGGGGGGEERRKEGRSKGNRKVMKKGRGV